MLRWQDDFEGTEINTTNWVVASLRDPVSGDHLGTGDHLLGYQYAGYITEEDTYAEGGHGCQMAIARFQDCMRLALQAP